MGFKKVQNSFAGGEQSPSLNARTDLQNYYNSLKKAQNVVITPEGCIKRRWGSLNLGNVTNTFNNDKLKFVEFSVTDKKKFLLIFGGSNLLVIDTENNTQQIYSDFLPFTYNETYELDFAQSLNTLIVTHPNHKPKLISSSNQLISGFNISDVSFKSIPKFNFNDNKSPNGRDFYGKLSVFNPAKTRNTVDSTRFSFQLNGNISEIINNGTGEYYPSIVEDIKVSIEKGRRFKFKMIEQKSGYRFDHDQKVNVNNNNNGFALISNFISLEDFYYDPSFTVADFEKYLSKELTRTFFYETCGVSITNYLLNNSRPLYPINVTVTNHDITTGEIREISILTGSYTLRANTNYSGTTTPSLWFDNTDPYVDYSVYVGERKKRPFAPSIMINNNPVGAVVTNSKPYHFQAMAHLKFESDVLREKCPDPKTYNDGSDQSLEIKYNANSSPWGIFFEVKNEIRKMNILNDMKNCHVWNGTRGLYIPYGGGNDPYKLTGDFVTKDLLKISEQNISKLSGFRTFTIGYDNSEISTYYLDEFMFTVMGDYVQPTDPFEVNKTADTSLDYFNVAKNRLQFPPQNQIIRDGNKIFSNVYAICIHIKGNDSRDFKLDMVLENDPTEYRQEDSLDDLAREALYGKAIIGQHGLNREEDVWSDERGYPSKCAFIESRLAFSNTKMLPNYIWFSEVEDYFNFKEGGELTSGFKAVPVQNTLEPVQYLVGSKSLQVFTTGTEHYNPKAVNAQEITLPLQSSYGVKAGIKPVQADSATYFIDRQNNLRSFIYDDLELSYKSVNVSIFASHLMKDAKLMREVKKSNANYIFIINNDGTMTVCQILREQQIINFVQWNSPYLEYIDIYNLNDRVYGLVKDKNLNQFYLTELLEDYPLDLTTDYNGYNMLQSEITGKFLSNTNTFKWSVINNVLSTVAIKDTRQFDWYESFREPTYNYDLRIYLSNAITNYQVGLNYDVMIETKDIAYDKEGQEVTETKKLLKAVITLNDALGWKLSKNNRNYLIRDYNDINGTGFGDGFKYKRVNGDIEVRLIGYDKRVNMIVYQDLPVRSGELQALTLEIKY